MGKTMYEYIFEQPDVLKCVLEHRREDVAVFIDLFRREQISRIYLIGSGSSLNAAKAAALAMEKLLHMEVTATASSALPQFRDRNVCLVFISQGGNSLNTVEAIKDHVDFPHIAITGVEKCVVNDISAHILIRCGEETAGPKTKGYVSTFFLLYCMALEVAKELQTITEEEYQKRLIQTEQAIGRMEKNIQTTVAWFNLQSEKMREIKKCVCIGKHIGQAVALESALKLQETILIPASGYEYEEFLHGPDMAIDEDMAGLYLVPDRHDKDYERFLKLVQYHRSKSPYVYTVGGGKDFNTDQDLNIGETDPEELKLFSWCLPSQIMGARIPSLLGIEGKGHKIFEELDEIVAIKAKHQAKDGV